MKTLILIIAVLVLCGCDTSSGGMLKVVTEAYPDAEVRPLPDSNYKFLVHYQNGDVFFVKCANSTNDAITYELIMFKGK